MAHRLGLGDLGQAGGRLARERPEMRRRIDRGHLHGGERRAGAAGRSLFVDERGLKGESRGG